MLPLVNARMTKVEAEPAVDEYGVPTGDPTDRWSGSVKAYVEDRMRYAQTGDRLDLVRDTRIKVDVEPAGKLVRQGDVLTFVRDGETFTRRARDVSAASLFGRVDVFLVEE